MYFLLQINHFLALQVYQLIFIQKNKFSYDSLLIIQVCLIIFQLFHVNLSKKCNAIFLRVELKSFFSCYIFIVFLVEFCSVFIFFILSLVQTSIILFQYSHIECKFPFMVR